MCAFVGVCVHVCVHLLKVSRSDNIYAGGEPGDYKKYLHTVYIRVFEHCTCIFAWIQVLQLCTASNRVCIIVHALYDGLFLLTSRNSYKCFRVKEIDEDR